MRRVILAAALVFLSFSLFTFAQGAGFESDILHQQSVRLNKNRIYDGALVFGKKALEAAESKVGDEHSAVAVSLHNWAEINFSKSEFEQAKPFYKRALTIQDKLYDKNDPGNTEVLEHLANLCLTRDQHQESVAYYKRSLAIREKQIGQNDQKLHEMIGDMMAIGHVYKSIGHVYMAAKNYPLAEPYYERAMEISEKVLGPDILSHVRHWDLLGQVYYGQGKNLQAEAAYKRALSLAVKLEGEESITSNRLRYGLVRFYVKTDRKEEAKLLEEEANRFRDIWTEKEKLKEQRIINLRDELIEMARKGSAFRKLVSVNPR